MMVPAPNIKHQRVLRRLLIELDRFTRGHGLGEVHVAPVDVVRDGRLEPAGTFARRNSLATPLLGGLQLDLDEIFAS